MYVCMYVCMYACMYVCMYIYMCMYVCIHIYMSFRTRRSPKLGQTCVYRMRYLARHLCVVLYTSALSYIHSVLLHARDASADAQREIERERERKQARKPNLLLTRRCPKLPRAKYSRFFECYVARFDHDCPWISNVSLIYY